VVRLPSRQTIDLWHAVMAGVMVSHHPSILVDRAWCNEGRWG
jgi:hypothetical protein